MNKSYEKALDKLCDTINRSTGIGHPDDLAKTVGLFDFLLESNQMVDHEDDIQTYLRETKKLDKGHARDIQIVYEALLSRKKGDGKGKFRPDALLHLIVD